MRRGLHFDASHALSHQGARASRRTQAAAVIGAGVIGPAAGRGCCGFIDLRFLACGFPLAACGRPGAALK